MVPPPSDDLKEKPPKELALFGGSQDWDSADWTASDDRVRGGKSESHLEIDKGTARFYGTLDTKTLGGAGFASQRTTGEDRKWDLSDYAGIQIKVKKGDKKRYTFILKDTLLPPDEETGREQSTISYECDFELPPQAEPGDSHDRNVFIPWESLNATYRGKLKKDAEPLDLKKVKRMSIMMRSFFGTQHGDFSLTITSISALHDVPSHDDLITTSPDELEAGNLNAEPPLSERYAGAFPHGIAKRIVMVRGRPLTALLTVLAVGLLLYWYR